MFLLRCGTFITTRQKTTYSACEYSFGNGYTAVMDRPLGHANEQATILRILKKCDLNLERAKGVLATQKASYISWISNPKGKIVAGAIVLLDRSSKRVILEELAVEPSHQGRKYGECLIRGWCVCKAAITKQEKHPSCFVPH